MRRSAAAIGDCGSASSRPDAPDWEFFPGIGGEDWIRLLFNGGYGGEATLFFARFNFFAWPGNWDLSKRRRLSVAKSSAPDGRAGS
jgi:hypothetical protein